MYKLHTTFPFQNAEYDQGDCVGLTQRCRDQLCLMHQIDDKHQSGHFNLLWLSSVEQVVPSSVELALTVLLSNTESRLSLTFLDALSNLFHTPAASHFGMPNEGSNINDARRTDVTVASADDSRSETEGEEEVYHDLSDFNKCKDQDQKWIVAQFKDIFGRSRYRCGLCWHFKDTIGRSVC